MNKEFYYLDGKDQKGPLSIDKLNEVGIKPETLVWSESMDNWKQAKYVSELADIIIRKVPPPPPIIDNSQTQYLMKEDSSQSYNNIIVEDSNVKSMVTLKIIISIILVFIIVTFIGFSFVENKKANNKKEIYEKIDAIFNNKTVVLDGVNIGVVGEKEETKYKRDVKSNVGGLNPYQLWWERDGLYTIYKLEKGGFNIVKLNKLGDDSFDYTILLLRLHLTCIDIKIS